jgi:hypothetical protein
MKSFKLSGWMGSSSRNPIWVVVKPDPICMGQPELAFRKDLASRRKKGSGKEGERRRSSCQRGAGHATLLREYGTYRSLCAERSTAPFCRLPWRAPQSE